jgi:hypothetical protein
MPDGDITIFTQLCEKISSFRQDGQYEGSKSG